jgi:hypothetical protein
MSEDKSIYDFALALIFMMREPITSPFIFAISAALFLILLFCFSTLTSGLRRGRLLRYCFLTTTVFGSREFLLSFDFGLVADWELLKLEKGTGKFTTGVFSGEKAVPIVASLRTSVGGTRVSAPSSVRLRERGDLGFASVDRLFLSLLFGDGSLSLLQFVHRGKSTDGQVTSIRGSTVLKGLDIE